MIGFFEKWLAGLGLPDALIDAAAVGATLVSVLLLALLVGWLIRKTFVPGLDRLVRGSSNQWDDTLAAHGFFRKFGDIIAVAVVFLAVDLFFSFEGMAVVVAQRLAMSLLVLVGVRAINSFLAAALEIYDSTDVSRERSVRGYVEVLKILMWVLAVILVVAVATGRSPWGIMSVLGGLTAVLLLVFKDTILGFVASLQISANNMVRVGDWIEMPQYGADGDVIAVSIHTVKVQNWDKTITTIPTYALVSSSFKNWRGMSESGGRRIKRAIYIDMNSIKFCDEELMHRLKEIDLLRDYLVKKQQEIEDYNDRYEINSMSEINGRRQTNIGIFRAYVVNYLKANPKINHEMTFLVRQLQPTAQGLPLEIYVFSADQAWANYEAIQADIFDHILASVPEFDLRVFQYPTGADLKNIMGEEADEWAMADKELPKEPF